MRSIDNGPRLGVINYGQSASIDSDQWWNIHRPNTVRQPEHALMVELIEDAKKVLSMRPATTHKARLSRERQKQDVLDWLDDLNGEYIFSFINCCEMLGLEPSVVRKELKALWCGIAPPPTSMLQATALRNGTTGP